MTRQAGTGGRGEATVVHGVREHRRDVSGRGAAGPWRAPGMGHALGRSPSFHPNAAVPMGMRADLSRLERAFPGYSFAISKGRNGPRLEAWRSVTQGGLYAVITDDPSELWCELGAAER